MLRPTLVLTAFALMALAVSAGAYAQPERAAPAPAEPPTYGSGVGGSVLLTNYGFGLGGIVRGRVTAGTSFVAELSVGAGKDEREQEFFIGYFGDTVVPFKRSNFLMLPLHIGLERRLFRDAIQDNFRPFVQLLGGPVFGYQWPYFDDANGNGVRDPNEDRLGGLRGFGDGSFRVGAGGTLAIGAYFGESARATQGIRIGYTANYFFEDVELLELHPEVESPNQRFFGTPVVSLHILRLF